MISNRTELNMKVRYKIVKNNIIIAVILDNGRIINIKETKVTIDNILISNENYYKDLDYVISNNIVREDGRSINVKRYEYEEETYQRIRYLISKIYK